MVLRVIVYFFIWLLIALGLSFLMAYPVMWLWNWLMPILFPTGVIAHTITVGQAFGLSILINLLHPNVKTNSKEE